MYDMTKLGVKYFETILPNGKYLLVAPPKLKALKKILALSKSINNGENGLTEDDIVNLIEGLSIALSRNKQNYKVTPKFIEEEMDITEITSLLSKYFEWVNRIQETKN